MKSWRKFKLGMKTALVFLAVYAPIVIPGLTLLYIGLISPFPPSVIATLAVLVLFFLIFTLEIAFVIPWGINRQRELLAELDRVQKEEEK